MASSSIFLSYSHKDEKVKDRLLVQLKVLESAGLVDLWNDDRITPGSNWKLEIDQALARASVAILLVTANFLTSDFILNKEVPEILERHKKDGLKVYPVIAKPCAWERVSWLTVLNVRPKNGKPVWGDGGRHVDRDLANIAREVADITPKVKGELVQAPDRIIQLTHVEEAIKGINTEIRNLAGVDHLIDLPSIERVIRLAISYGAPIYNRGLISGCAEIYLHTAKYLKTLLHSSGTGEMTLIDEMRLEEQNEPGLPRITMPQNYNSRVNQQSIGVAIAHDELFKVSTMSDITEQNADSIAWEIRYTFDHILLVTRGVKAVDNVFVSIQKENGKLKSQVLEVIKLANSFAALIYDEGLMRKKIWIRGAAAIYLHTVRKMLSILSMLESSTESRSESDRECIEVCQIQLSYVKITNVIDSKKGEDAYKLAWDIRITFDRIIDAIG